MRILWSFVTIQQRSHAFSPELNNGNAVPMRSKGILTMGTAFPRVPPRNDHWHNSREWHSLRISHLYLYVKWFLVIFSFTACPVLCVQTKLWAELHIVCYIMLHSILFAVHSNEWCRRTIHNNTAIYCVRQHQHSFWLVIISFNIATNSEQRCADCQFYS